MNCCDYECNQGRNCPARIGKVGQRMQGPEPLPPSSWRDKLPDIARWLLVCVAMLWMVAFTVLIA
jgi:hypothetical protein